MHYVWRLSPLLLNILIVSCLEVCISSTFRGRLQTSNDFAAYAKVGTFTAPLGYLKSSDVRNLFFNCPCGLQNSSPLTDVKLANSDDATKWLSRGPNYKHPFIMCAKKEPVQKKRKIFSSRRKKKYLQKELKKKQNDQNVSSGSSSSEQINVPTSENGAETDDKSHGDADNISAVFVFGHQSSPLNQVNDNSVDTQYDVGGDAHPENIYDGVDVDRQTMAISMPHLGSGSSLPEGVHISKRRLHALEALFSDQHALKTRQIVSMFYHLLGSLNTELIDMFGDLRDSGPSVPHDSENDVSSTKTAAHRLNAVSNHNLLDGSGGSTTPDDINEDTTPLASIPQRQLDYDGLKWPFEGEDGSSALGNGSEDGDTVSRKHLGDNPSSVQTNLSRRDMRQLKHLKMLAQHEKLKLLKGIDHSRSVSAVFFSPENPSSADLSVPTKAERENQTTDNGLLKLSQPYNEAGDVMTTCKDDLNSRGKSTQAVPLVKLSSQQNEVARTRPNYDEYIAPYSVDAKDGGSTSTTNNRFDRFIVSIPKVQEVHVKTETKPNEDKSSQETDSVLFDIPVTMFSLRRGFLGTLYRTYLRPSLVSALEASFQVKLTAPCGIMDFDRLDLSAIANTGQLGLNIDRDELRKYLRNVVVHSHLTEGERDVIEYKGTAPDLPEATRLKIAQLLKWMKDEVFLRGGINILTTLLGRSPNLSELAFALGHDNPDQLEVTLDICSAYTQWSFEGLSNPLGEIILMKLESDWGIERKKKDGPLEIIDMHMCNTQAVVSNVLWRRMCSIHLNTLSSLGSRAVSQLYGAACSSARQDLLKAKLPEHLPMGRYRLARRAKALYEELCLLQGRVKQEFRKAGERGVTLYDGIYKNNPFVDRVLAVERAYSNVKEGSVDGFMRDRAHHDVLVKEMESRLEVSWGAICEAWNSLEVREVGTLAQESDPDMPSPFKRIPDRKRVFSYDELDEKEEPHEDVTVYSGTDSLRDIAWRKSLRMLAKEALDDRVARFVFMASLGLFTQGQWSHEELAKLLGFSSADVVNLIFCAARAHCHEYEVWRIKLKLPPYVDETRTFPMLLESLKFPPHRMPHHIAAATEKSINEFVDDSRMNAEAGLSPHPFQPSMKDRCKRLREIKPRMGTMKESLLKYRKNYASMQRVLEKSPLYYLAETS